MRDRVPRSGCDEEGESSERVVVRRVEQARSDERIESLPGRGVDRWARFEHGPTGRCGKTLQGASRGDNSEPMRQE